MRERFVRYVLLSLTVLVLFGLICVLLKRGQTPVTVQDNAAKQLELKDFVECLSDTREYKLDDEFQIDVLSEANCQMSLRSKKMPNSTVLISPCEVAKKLRYLSPNFLTQEIAQILLIYQRADVASYVVQLQSFPITHKIEVQYVFPNPLHYANFFRAIKELAPDLPVAQQFRSGSSKKLHATCALVGNSPSLLTQQFGRSIDEHEAVFRIGFAPTQKYEEFVGTKVTYRLLHDYHLATKLSEEGQEKYIILNPFSEKFLEDFSTFTKKFHSILSSQRMWFSTILQPIPGSGGYSLETAMELCEHLDIYGFEKRSKYNISHYWENAISKPHSNSIDFDLAFLKVNSCGKVYKLIS